MAFSGLFMQISFKLWSSAASNWVFNSHAKELMFVTSCVSYGMHFVFYISVAQAPQAARVQHQQLPAVTRLRKWHL